MTVISLIQQKGGAGKTTGCLGLALAAKLDRPKRAVHVVDLDRQSSASAWIAQHKLPLVAHQNWQHVPTDELVFCDTPGLDAVSAAEGLRRADLVIVPLRPSMMDWTVSLLTIKAILNAKKRAAWLPSQIDTRRGVERDLAARTLPEAMQNGSIPSWPILPVIRYLSSVPVFLSGVEGTTAAADFEAAWREVEKLLKMRK